MDEFDPALPLRMIDALHFAAKLVPDNAAILTPNRPSLSYRQLVEHVEYIAGILNGFGLKRHSRVILLIPNGAEAVSVIYAVSTVCTAVLVNPESKRAEIEHFIQRSQAEAVIVQCGVETPAREIARAHDLRVIELVVNEEAPAGFFELEDGATSPPTFAEPDDIALIIPTSGTSGLPKLIPVTHRKLLVDAYANPAREMMSATPDNPRTSINMLPLFHILGLGNLTSALSQGWGLVAAPGFSVKSYFELIDTYHPLGMTVLPAMLKELVEAAPNFPEFVARSSVRYFSLASAPLSIELGEEARRTFNADLLITYGMTELGGLTVISTLSGNYYRPGSVGQAVPGIEIIIANEDGSPLPEGEVGEVLVRKRGAFTGYVGDPQATASFQHAGWFHTGDLGYLDPDGNLFLKGRLKEIVNRGGEKVSPDEVEHVLIQHPAIREAAVFGIPNLALGEDLAAAVVVCDPTITARTLRIFVAEALTSQKVPGKILIVDKLPRTATGKLQRSALPRLLGLIDVGDNQHQARLPLAPASVAPRSSVEQQLAEIWTSTLGIADISIHDDFFDALGGTSLQGAQLVINVGKAFSLTLPVSSLLEAPTIAEMATLMSNLSGNVIFSSLIPIQPYGSKPPLFCVPAFGGQVVSFRPLSLHLGIDQPVYGLQTPGSDGTTRPFDRIDALAEYLVKAIRAKYPTGPYLLLGKSYGGMVALEIARQLRQSGENVALLGLLDSALGLVASSQAERAALGLRRLVRRVKHHSGKLAAMTGRERTQYINERTARIGVPVNTTDTEELLPGVREILVANTKAIRHYRPHPYPHPIVYFSARQTRNPEYHFAYEAAWQKIATGGLIICDVPGEHASLEYEPNVQVLAEKLRHYIDAALVEAVETGQAKANGQLDVLRTDSL